MVPLPNSHVRTIKLITINDICIQLNQFLISVCVMCYIVSSCVKKRREKKKSLSKRFRLRESKSEEEEEKERGEGRQREKDWGGGGGGGGYRGEGERERERETLTIIALTMSLLLFLRARTAFARETLACCMTSSMSLSSTPVSSTCNMTMDGRDS